MSEENQEFIINFKDPYRELSPIEFSNLNAKVKKGTLPVEYFRKNLFNATTRESREYKKNYKKLVFDDGTLQIFVNRSLHQRHRDLLSILFIDNQGVSKLNPDGSYTISTNLYHIAKEMNYRKPKDANAVVRGFLDDLRSTDVIFKIKDKTNVDVSKLAFTEAGHKLLGDYKFHEETGHYEVTIPPQTAKFHILSYAVQIPKNLNKEILAIPIKFAKTKALISFLLSNEKLKNGIYFDTVCEKLEITKENKSRFKKELKDSTKVILEKFGITYNIEESKFYIKDACEVQFERNITQEEALKSYAVNYSKLDGIKNINLDEEFNIDVIDASYINLHYKDKYITIKSKTYKYLDIKKDEEGFIQLLLEIEKQQFFLNTKINGYEEIEKKLKNYNLIYQSLIPDEF